MKISRIICYEVVVPAKTDAIDSKSVSKPLHKLSVGAKSAWSLQFDELPKLIVQLELGSGLTGWGELYRNHDWNTVASIANMLLGRDIESIVLQKMPFAYSREYDGFECALADVYAKVHSMRVVDLIGGPVKDKVKVGGWSSHRTLDDIPGLVKKFDELGYDCVKFKCDLDDDIISWCKSISDNCSRMKVILDPNERWQHSYEAAKRMRALNEIGNLLCVEDPVPRWKLSEYASLRNLGLIPVALHVSLPYLLHGQKSSDAIQAIKMNAIDCFNFNAGIADFQKLDHIATVAEIPCWHGSEIDLGILEAMYVHSAAAASSCTLPSDIFGTLIREHDLLKEPLRFEPPFVYLPKGTGLGVEPDIDVIKSYMVDKKEFLLKGSS